MNLRAVGVRNTGSGPRPEPRSRTARDGTYKNDSDSVSLTHAQLVAEAQAGTPIVTLTAALRSGYGTGRAAAAALARHRRLRRSPAIRRSRRLAAGAGDPPAFTVTGTDVRGDAALFVDGAPATGTLTCTGYRSWATSRSTSP